MSNTDWATKDFYAVLGVAKDADAKDIKKSYRKLARENHPDSNPGDTAKHERFKQVAEAYDVVGDSKKRQEYDQIRSAYAQGGFPGGFPGGFQGQGQHFDLGDILGGMFGGGGGGQRRPQARRGSDIESQTTIGFLEAARGTELSLRLRSDAPCGHCRGTGGKPGTTPHRCHTCKGTGTVTASVGGGFMMNETCPTCGGRQLVYDDPCPACHGSGHGLSERTITARIPAGVKDGQKIKLSGKGGAGEVGGPAGDLYVVVNVRPHRLFKRSGDNLVLEVPVAFDEAALGAQITVPTLDSGPVTVKIPAGTPNGRTFRVRGTGIRSGDLLVTVSVQVPASLTDVQKEAVEALRAANGGADPRAGLFVTMAGD